MQGDCGQRAQRVGDIIGEITAASSEQSLGISQVNQAVGDIDRMTQQNAAWWKSLPPPQNRCASRRRDWHSWSASSSWPAGAACVMQPQRRSHPGIWRLRRWPRPGGLAGSKAAVARTGRILRRSTFHKKPGCCAAPGFFFRSTALLAQAATGPAARSRLLAGERRVVGITVGPTAVEAIAVPGIERQVVAQTVRQIGVGDIGLAEGPTSA